MENNLSQTQIDSALRIKESMENEIKKAMFEGTHIEIYEHSSDKKIEYDGRYYLKSTTYNDRQIGNDFSLAIFDNDKFNFQGPHTEVGYTYESGITRIVCKVGDDRHKLFRPAYMRFIDGEPDEVRYCIDGKEYSEKDFNSLMNGPLGRALAGAPRKEVLDLLKLTESVVERQKTKTRKEKSR